MGTVLAIVVAISTTVPSTAALIDAAWFAAGVSLTAPSPPSSGRSGRISPCGALVEPGPDQLPWQKGSAASAAPRAPARPLEVEGEPGEKVRDRGRHRYADQPRNHEAVVQQVLADVRGPCPVPVSYTHLRAHETPEHLVCRLLLE